jgi:hypothetical protein
MPGNARHLPDSAKRVVIELPKPMPASNDCLPHAAMNLGAARGSGMRMTPGMVSRLVFQEQFGAWCLFRLDDRGGFVGDTWHPDLADAYRTAAKEFGLDASKMPAGAGPDGEISERNISGGDHDR